MTDRCPPDLLYGHLGACTYDASTSTWSFSREPRTLRGVQHVTQPIYTVEPSAASAESHFELSNRAGDLNGLYPELVPSTSRLRRSARTSALINEIVSSNDPTKSDLLALGKITNFVNPRPGLKSFPIVALAAGSAGELVKFVLLGKEHLGWEGNKKTGVLRWTADGGEAGYWKGNGVPIQQLVFAEINDGSESWLAARYQSQVSIFRPVLKQNSVFPTHKENPHMNLPSSRLDTNHIITLSTQSTTGVPFADVSFNPWYPRQIVTTDQVGEWSIWNITRDSQKKGLWTASRTSGQNVEIQSDEFGKSAVQADGWGRCLWIGDLNTIFVATRRALAIFNVKDIPTRLPVPDLALANSTDWILDVRRCQSYKSVVFVLTSSRIFWLQVWTMEAVKFAMNGEAGAFVLLSWIHFRDPHDYSLQLDMYYSSVDDEKSREDCTTTIVLYSRLSGVCTAFSSKTSLDSGHIISSSDPYELRLPRMNTNSGTELSWDEGPPKTIANVAIWPVKYDSLYGHQVSGIAQDFYKNDISFHQLNILYSDLSLSESVFAQTGSKACFHIPAPDIKIRLDIAKTSLHASRDFVVPDSLGSSLAYPRLIPRRGADIGSQVLPQSMVDEWTISLEWLRSPIRQPFNMHFEDSVSENSAPRFFEGYLKSLRSGIENKIDHVKPTIQSMHEMVDVNYHVPDIDSASTAFSHLVESTFAYAAKNLPLPAFEGEAAHISHKGSIPNLLTPALQRVFGVEGYVQISNVYDGLVQASISPLSPQVPGRTRIAIEKILRNLAVPLCLAGYGIHVRPNEIDEPKIAQVKDQVSEFLFSLPVRRKASQPTVGPKGTEKARLLSSPPPTSFHVSEDSGFVPSSASQALPTPEPTPSIRSHGSVCPPSESEDPSSLRLGYLATTDVQRTLPAKMQILLARWTLGADPADYDWDAVTQRVDVAGGEDNNVQMQEDQNVNKRHKRASVNLRGSLSQPLSRDIGEDSYPEGSQMYPEHQGIMSQPQPGPSGARQTKSSTGKKKRKPAGFK